MKLSRCLAAAACAAAMGSFALAAPYPRAGQPAAQDLGAVAPGAASQISLTVALKLRNPEQLQNLLQSVYDPKSAQYRHFLSTQEFASQFAPSAETVARVTSHFEKAGFTVARQSTAQLKISGSAAAVQSEFKVQLHQYAVPASGRSEGFSFRAPTSSPTVAADIADAVQGTFGFSTRPRMRPHLRHAGPLTAPKQIVGNKKGQLPNTPDVPGLWTVIDFADYYNVKPLYDAGINGSKQTLGIMTFASFTSSDAYTYWHDLGLKVSSSRIHVAKVDGGSGAPSDDAGSDETTLDVEQSGGVAPGADIIVYEAPNTTDGFIDLFAAAIDQNKADTLSISWGEWEWFDVIPADDVVDPVNGHTTTTFRAVNDVLMQAALQGQSVFASSGDAGAYDANDPPSIFPYPAFSKVVSVDDPAAQPFITAAGGTTLPGPQEYLLKDGSTYTVTIKDEQAWGWDYLTTLCKKLGYDTISCGIFPGGGGGGVSSYAPLPIYQYGVHGIAVTPAGQKLVNLSGTTLPDGIDLPVKLPANFRGRNVPDLSVNADPDTGYVLLYTSSTDGFTEYDFYGGTSFAAPQLNGVASLLTQGLHRRIGLLNFPLYNILRYGQPYDGKEPPLRDIRSGDNWYWDAHSGYDQATGVGVPNVANLLETLRRPNY